MIGTKDSASRRFVSTSTYTMQTSSTTFPILSLNYRRPRSSGSPTSAPPCSKTALQSGWRRRSRSGTRRWLCRRTSWSTWIRRSPRSSSNPAQSAVSDSANYFLIIISSSNTASKGVSANMLQAGSKRRRTKKQIEEEKKAEILKRQQTEAKITNYNAMQMKV